jgi:hypothetical protein
MAFYSIPFGHVEVHVDPRPQRPPDYFEAIAARREQRKPRRLRG